MDDSTARIDTHPTRRPPGGGGGGRRIGWILLVVALALVWLGIWQRDRIAGWFAGAATVDAPATGARGAAADDGPGMAGGADVAAAEAEVARRADAWRQTLGRDPAWPVDVADPRDCEAIGADWQAACGQVPGLDCADLDAALFELLRNPPRASGEFQDHAIVLANATHLFRTLGRKRVEALRSALDDAGDRLEPLALTVYRRVASRGACAGAAASPSAGPAPPPRAAYDYAAYLFQTLGGQAYLRRRDPRVEALASFYALEILDRADRDGANPEGVDPLPEMRRARALIAAQPFLFRDAYLQELDRLEDRWRRRAEGRGE